MTSNTPKSQEITDFIPWVEKYRPSQFHDIVLDPLNREIFHNILNKNYFPHLLFYGPPGTGKTTTIINLINEFQSKYHRINKSNVIHLNASDERGIDIIRNQIHQFAKSMNLFEQGIKIVILDEVDYMTKNAQQALKYILQTSSYNVRFCLICNYITKIDESLKNEFLCIRFNQLPRKDIFQFIRNICNKEEIELTNEQCVYTLAKFYLIHLKNCVRFMEDNIDNVSPFVVASLVGGKAFLNKIGEDKFSKIIHTLNGKIGMAGHRVLD